MCSSPKRRGRGRECWHLNLASAPSRRLQPLSISAANPHLFLANHHHSHRIAFRAISAVYRDCKNRTAWFEPLSQLQRYGISHTSAATPHYHPSFGDDKHNQTFQTRVFDLFGELKPTLHVSLILKTTSLMRSALLRKNLRLTRKTVQQLHPQPSRLAHLFTERCNWLVPTSSLYSPQTCDDEHIDYKYAIQWNYRPRPLLRSLAILG